MSDYRNRELTQSRAETTNHLNHMWWDIPIDTDKGQVVAAIWEQTGAMIDKMKPHYEITKRFEEFYLAQGNIIDRDFNISNYFSTQTNAASFNVIRSSINAIHNKIAKVKPKVTSLTKNKTFSERYKAKQLDNFFLDTFKKGGLYEEAPRAFLDSTIGTIGIVKLSQKNNKFHFFKVDPLCWFCSNPYDGKNRSDQEGEFAFMTLYDVMDLYPKKKEELKEYHGVNPDSIVEVREVYRLGKRKAVLTEKVLLEYVSFEKEELPYEHMIWTTKPRGKIGTSIAQEIINTQEKINYMSQKISESTDLLAKGRIFVSEATGLEAEDITNETGSIVQFKGGQPPIFSNPPIMHEQYFRHLSFLIEWSFQQAGITQEGASGQAPRGIDAASGIALRTSSDMQSERFQLVKERYEMFFIKMAKKMCKYATKSMIPDNLKEANLKECLDHISMYPSNLLPETPAGQIATIQELLQAQLVNKDEALSMLASPDVDKLLSHTTATHSAVVKEIEDAIMKEEDILLDDTLGLDVQLDKARMIYAQLVSEGRDMHSKKIQLLDAFIKNISAKIQAAQQAEIEQQQQQQQQQEQEVQGQQGQPQL